MFIDIQFPLSQSVHLIVLGREVYGYALFVLYLHAGTSCLKGAAILIKHVLFSCEFLLRILQKILHVTAWTHCTLHCGKPPFLRERKDFTLYFRCITKQGQTTSTRLQPRSQGLSCYGPLKRARGSTRFLILTRKVSVTQIRERNWVDRRKKHIPGTHLTFYHSLSLSVNPFCHQQDPRAIFLLFLRLFPSS